MGGRSWWEFSPARGLGGVPGRGRHELSAARDAAQGEGGALRLAKRQHEARGHAVAAGRREDPVGGARPDPGGVVLVVGIAVRDAPVIDLADGEEGRQLRGAAEMVDVEMGQDEVVDPRQPGLAGGAPDAPGVARPRIARVDQDRFAGGGDDEGAAAPFHIVPVDIEAMVGLVGAGARQEGKADEHGQGRGGESHGVGGGEPAPAWAAFQRPSNCIRRWVAVSPTIRRPSRA